VHEIEPRRARVRLERLAAQPLTGERPNPRHVRYDVGDPLLRFWFRFVFPHQSQLLRLGSQRAWSEHVKPRLDAYFGNCFERLCREALPRLYEREGVRAAFEVGEYWSQQTQIDVVSLRTDGWTDLGECKWGTVRSASAVEGELEAKVKSYPNRRNATLGRRIFTRGKRPGRPGSSAVRWHTLEDLYD
jgi:AAA+ ATPase superfamily predicted ATPase